MLQTIGHNDIVRVDEPDVISRGVIHTRIPGSADSRVALGDDFDLTKPAGVCVQDCRTIISRAVVDADDLVIIRRNILLRAGIQTLRQVFPGIVYRNYHTQKHSRHLKNP